MMKNISNIVMCIGVALLLVGCGGIPNRFSEYQNSCNRPPLAVPPCIHPEPFGDDLTIPNACECSTRPALLPPESLALQVAEGKLSKKALKQYERNTKLTCVTRTHNRYGMPALKTNKALGGTWNNVERALKQLSPLYRIQHRNEALGTFYIYDLSVTKGKVCATTPIYQLRLTELENGTMISLTADQPGVILPENVVHRVLSELAQALETTREGLSLKQWLFD